MKEEAFGPPLFCGVVSRVFFGAPVEKPVDGRGCLEAEVRRVGALEFAMNMAMCL
jgi:hypothetical protein